MNTHLINLTSHAVTFSGIIDDQPQMITIEQREPPARVETKSHERGMIDGCIPIQCQTLGDITGLPAPKANTVYVVSTIVLNALKTQGSTRSDVIAPATGPRDNAIRNNDGQILAVTTFNSL